MASTPHEPLDSAAAISFRDAARVAVGKAMAEIDEHWAGALGGDDVEAVHDLRVGTRRLRAALSVYEGAFPRREFRRVEQLMARLTDALGPARDTDVLIEHLEASLIALGAGGARASERAGIADYVEHLRAARSGQQQLLLRAMRRIDIDSAAAALGIARPSPPVEGAS